jgi:hypothetical protein
LEPTKDGLDQLRHMIHGLKKNKEIVGRPPPSCV